MYDPWPGLEVGTHLLGKEMDSNGVLVWIGPQFNLRQHLVGEGVAHHEAGVSHRTAQVDQPALGQHDDSAPVLQPIAVHLQVGRVAVKAGNALMSTLASFYPLAQQACLPPTAPVRA